MVRPAIIDKLDLELREPISAEKDVVYLLVELRKLMEHNGDKDVYPSLRFHCDWAVHTLLAGPTAQRLVQQFDKYQGMVETIQAAPGQQIPPEYTSVLTTIGDLFSLTHFRHELADYLRQNGLNSAITDDDASWATFLRHYARVIEDCPLKCRGQNLAYVDEVVMRVADAKADPGATAVGYRLAIEWTWTSKTSGVTTVTEHKFY